MKDHLSRRKFIAMSSLAGATLSAPLISRADDRNLNAIPEKLTVLFQGDSITDAGRNRGRYYPNDTWGGLGNGYALMAAGELMGTNTATEWKCYNRGISGNKVHQLADRWDDDCLNLDPDVLSILIGVNDFWHTLTHDYAGTSKVYEDDLRKLLDRTRQHFPDVKLILGEPFVVLGGSAIDKDSWVPAFAEYQDACKRVADDYSAAWIPYQQVFDKALASNDVDYWCPDGVHPSIAGNWLMADAWLKAFGELYK